MVRMKSNKILNNQQGLSLVEVLIAAGILGLVSLGFAEMMRNQAFTQKRADMKNVQLQLTQAAQSAAMDAKAIIATSVGKMTP
jgi:prepilin-type N-terminal cleavage/methylation domain-containing protein